MSNYTRAAQVDRLSNDSQPWDMVVIGGGATGMGIAVDAATRGYRVALFEQHDFGKGTSSRSTKLIHGGLRYLQQFHFRLVRSALRERGLLCKNAPHIVHPLPTLVPLHSRWEQFYYGIGLKVYDGLSGHWSLGKSRHVSLAQALEKIPTLETHGLVGGVLYLDGAFDDARLLVNLMQTAIDQGAVCLNYAPVRELSKQSGRICGIVAEDAETGKELRIAARVVVNAAGPFSDAVQRLDDQEAETCIAPSQGIHLVFDRAFLPGETALIVPRTRDGRVIFAVPWHGHTVVGTTDTPLAETSVEPQPRPAEIEFLLETIAPYLSRKPQQSDIRAIFAGIRPLVRAANTRSTSQLGRDHLVQVSDSGLVSVMGGKWTTYRHMAEDAVNRAAAVAEHSARPCTTTNLPIHGAPTTQKSTPQTYPLYGSDASQLAQLIDSNSQWQQPLHPRLETVGGQVIWAARQEMAKSVEDVLARRTRALFLDVEAALSAAPRVAELLAAEFGRDAAWQADQLAKFHAVAEHFQPPSST
jgi:glycerol-3-phosphate dehydrogenase